MVGIVRGPTSSPSTSRARSAFGHSVSPAPTSAMIGDRSSTVTDQPIRRSPTAAASPPIPAPMISALEVSAPVPMHRRLLLRRLPEGSGLPGSAPSSNVSIGVQSLSGDPVVVLRKTNAWFSARKGRRDPGAVAQLDRHTARGCRAAAGAGAGGPLERRQDDVAACRRRTGDRGTAGPPGHGSGTYTARPKVAKWLGMIGFSEDVRRRGMRPGSTMLEFRHQKAERAAARRVRIPVGDPIIAFTRLRLADDVPMVVERTTLPAWLRARPAGRGPERVAVRPAHHPVRHRSRQRHLPARTGHARRQDRRLGPTSRPPSPASPSTASASTAAIASSEYTSALYRGDRYAFTTELRTTPTPRADARGL